MVLPQASCSLGLISKPNYNLLRMFYPFWQIASPPSRRSDYLPPKSCLLLKSIEFQEGLVWVHAIPGSNAACRPSCQRSSHAVQLETHRPIDLVSDRSADSLRHGLSNRRCRSIRRPAHPTVQLVSRDREQGYAGGANRGAPQAIQVADRFHLLCNLTSAVERVLGTKRSELSKACEPEELKVE
jgi:hypothetical protein